MELFVTTHWRRIVERSVGDIAILDVRGGPIEFSHEPAQLLDAVRQLAERGRFKIVLNLSDVPYIDSTGLSEIVEGFKICKAAGGMVKLCEVAPSIRRLLHVTKLDGIIEAFETEDAALRSFASQV